MCKKLSIILRACHLEVTKESIKNQSRPAWFDKLRCFKSFYQEFGNRDNIEITVVFDGNETHEFAQYIKQFKIKDIIYLNEVGNKGSLIYCYNLMKELDGEYLCLQEEDYLFVPGAYSVLIDGLETFGEIGPITLYDHADRYFSNQDITKGHDYIFCCKTSHFRTAESTTGTVAMSRNIFNKVKEELINCHIQDCLFYRNILEKQNIRLFSPIPGFSTHVNRFFMTPHRDWLSINNSISI